jgi:hypothetical protein
LRPDATRVDPLRTDAHADPLHRDHIHTHGVAARDEWYHKRPPKWIAAPLLLALVVVGVAAANERHDNWQGANGYGDQLPHASVAYQGQVWVPQGAPVLLPDRRMVKVGETVEGHDLYRVSVNGGGGGGSVAQPLVSPETVFLKAGQDQYQPLLLRHIGSVGPAIVGPR